MNAQFMEELQARLAAGNTVEETQAQQTEQTEAREDTIEALYVKLQTSKRGGFYLLPAKDCFILGGMEGVPYWQQSVHLAQGDLLFMYTKGLVEAENTSQVQYSAEHMQMRLNEVMKEAYELKDMIEIMEKDVEDFREGAPREQDVAMLLLRFY